ncbi:hypothetical protein HK096_003035 [Nowakowskiella sp. JEL0078]|nr:hypothetical protein HK096_003035 [Nowakowskiella sp. JEL0078]
MFGILEAPTLMLSVASINKNLRHDNLYGALFFVTRIVLHLVLVYRLFTDFSDRKFWVAPLSVFPLHIIWFNRWIQQQRRKWVKRKDFNKEAKKAATADVVDMPKAAKAEITSGNVIRPTGEINREFVEERLPLPTSPTRRIMEAMNRVRRFMNSQRGGFVGHMKRPANGTSFGLINEVSGKRVRLGEKEVERVEKENVGKI